MTSALQPRRNTPGSAPSCTSVPPSGTSTTRSLSDAVRSELCEGSTVAHLETNCALPKSRRHGGIGRGSVGDRSGIGRELGAAGCEGAKALQWHGLRAWIWRSIAVLTRCTCVGDARTRRWSYSRSCASTCALAIASSWAWTAHRMPGNPWLVAEPELRDISWIA